MPGFYKKLYILLCLLWIVNLRAQNTTVFSNPDSVADNFMQQLTLLPQEKLYVQTDKPHYISGEKIWFRAHLADALLHRQANASRYVYAELVNPLDSVVCRVKIHPDSLGLFHGYLPIDEDLADGHYMLRAYTLYMKNMGDDYFFKKTIKITHPLSVRFDTKVTFTPDDNTVRVSFQFIDKRSGLPFKPENATVQVNGGREQKLRFNEDTIAGIPFEIPKEEKHRVLTVRLQYETRMYVRYIPVPFPDSGYEVSFFPEGGHLLAGVTNSVAFKALKSNGLSENVSMYIVSNEGDTVCSSKTLHLGMGYFHLYADPGKTYFAVCTNTKNISKRFELPSSVSKHCGLNIKWVQNKLYVSLNRTPDDDKTQKRYLLAHIRGAAIYCKEWDDSNNHLVFNKDFFPSGISHLVLYDQTGHILSERLIFNLSEKDTALLAFSTDKNNYAQKQRIILTVKITDNAQTPLPGNFSISVTDDNDVIPDTCNTILTNLLLTSELKGYIENPAYYLKQDDRTAKQALDLLMTTQGWRRYPVADVIRGKLKEPLFQPETGQSISGKADGIFRSVKDGHISVLALTDTITEAHAVQTDKNGRFELNGIDYPDGTRFIVQAKTGKGKGRVFLEMDKPQPYPAITSSLPYEESLNKDLPNDYIVKADEKYIAENGMRLIDLAEIEVTAKRKPKTNSMYYSAASSNLVLTSDDIEERRIFDIKSLLVQIPGLIVNGNSLSVRGRGAPLIVVDDVPDEDYDVFSLDVSDIGNLFLIKDASAGVMFGQRGTNGALVITTKRGITPVAGKSHNISNFLKPLGYQKPEQFYSPQYNINREYTTPDLRTTIYWKPDVKVSETGEVTLDFYAADAETTYSVVMEGISDYGHLICNRFKIQRTK